MRATIWLLALLCAGQSVAGEGGAARRALESFSNELASLHASFRQTVTAQDGRVESDGRGEVWLARPALFRWVYQGEFPELIVADGRHVWLYDEDLEQVTVKVQSGLAEDSPLLLLTDLTGLDERFRVTELGDYEGLQLLELLALGAESEFERVVLGFSEAGIALMAMEDAFGLRTEIRFHEVVRNPELPDDLFSFRVPENADVVGDLENEPLP